MRQMTFTLLITLFLGAASTAQAQEHKTAPQKTATSETTTDTEKPKTEVDRIIAEAHKRGETVLAACVDPKDCGEESDQIVNVEKGRVVELQTPVYPPIARAAHAQGTVVVQVLIDEEGKIMAAAAVSGHPLLWAAAVKAARGSVFTPTKLEGRPVKVTGVIQYNFVAQ